MTTIIDPVDVPVPVYNRSGVTIVEMQADHHSDNPPPTSATPIPHVSGHTIAIVTGAFGSFQNFVQLPSAEIGDLVEIYVVGKNTFIIASPGTTVDGQPTVSVSRGLYRKVSATSWRTIGTP